MIARLLERRRFMREHRWTTRHLSDYLDEDLSTGERQRVEEHVGLCPQCRRVLRTLRVTLEGLVGLRSESQARPGVTESVLERLRRER